MANVYVDAEFLKTVYSTISDQQIKLIQMGQQSDPALAQTMAYIENALRIAGENVWLMQQKMQRQMYGLVIIVGKLSIKCQAIANFLSCIATN